MTTISKRPQDILEKLGYQVLSVKNREMDEINTHFGNVGFLYNCIDRYSSRCKVRVTFHTHEKTFTLVPPNGTIRRKGVVNNTVFHY